MGELLAAFHFHPTVDSLFRAAVTEVASFQPVSSDRYPFGVYVIRRARTSVP
ncbi:hypothetical protein OHA89_01300 [Streptomyces sp. NBC_01546]